MKKIINLISVTLMLVGLFNLFSLNSYKKQSISYCLNPEKIRQIEVNYNYKPENYLNQNLSYYTDEPKISFLSDSKIIEVKKIKNIELSNIRNGVYNSSFVSRVKIMNFAYQNGFTKDQAINYVFPEIEQAIWEIEKNNCFSPTDAKVEVLQNTANVCVIKSKNGVKINKNAIFDDIFNQFNNLSNNYVFKINYEKVEADLTEEEIKKQSFLRGSYKTYFGSSFEERKNNIKIALKSLDGKVVNPGEILSFNATTGYRTQENGYQKAKIIKQGTFSQEFGGGVCQVSTTLYNCALLSDLEVIEVNPHSLPVAYEQPCFDAMVNSGSSDLKIKNNTECPIYIATSSVDDFCKINIFGVQNNYKILRKSKKIKEIAEIEKMITDDYKQFGLETPLGEGEQKIISKGKKGFVATGCLEYYSDDVLIKTKQIRKNTYYPTKEVVLVSSIKPEKKPCEMSESK